MPDCFEIGSVKLIVWDLDGTFWEGTLSEGDVAVPKERVKLLEDLTDCGIINSICSRNDFEKAKARLEEASVWDLFVSPSISWEAKGPRLKQLLESLSLRPANTLFIDDNPSNRGEAGFYLPGIQTASPEVLETTAVQLTKLERSDPERSRLAHYKTLERRNTAFKASTSSEQFLYDSDIQVSICHDCMQHKERILELINRTNQLNFTKKRISSEDLESQLQDPGHECGYISSKDRFGDYGIVGFYALKENRLEHFAFSCRTMGQRIEQWVYAQLGFPKITVNGEVASHLDRVGYPGWINQTSPSASDEVSDSPETSGNHCRSLLKGPCDLSHSLVYLKGAGLFDTELGYTTAEGKIVAAHNHSVHIVGLHEWSEEQRREIERDCVFVDPAMLHGKFFSGQYSLIVLSTSFESYYQIYRNRASGMKVAFAGVNLTNPKYWPGLIDGTLYTGGNAFSEEYLKEFADKYEYIGITRPETYLGFLENCLKWLPDKTTLCLILGATRFIDNRNMVGIRHEKLNSAIKDFAKSHPRIRLIEIDDFINDASDFLDSINHFSARVYYEIAQAIVSVIRETTGLEIKSRPRETVRFDSFVLSIRKRLVSLIKPGSVLYTSTKGVYDRIYKKRS